MWDEFHWVRIKPRSRDRWGHYDLIQPQPYLLILLGRLYCVSYTRKILLHYLCANANISRAKVVASVNSIRTNKITRPDFMTLFSLSAARGGICINPEWFICFPRRLVRVLKFLFVESHTLTLKLKNLFKIFTRRTFKQTVSTLTLGCFSAKPSLMECLCSPNIA